MGVDNSALDAFMELKRRGTPRWVSFKIENGSVVEERRGSERVRSRFGRTAFFLWDPCFLTTSTVEWEQGDETELYEALPQDECRYAVFDHRGTDNDGCKKSKIFFIMWCEGSSLSLLAIGPNRESLALLIGRRSPDGAPTKNRMQYTSSKNSFKERLQGWATLCSLFSRWLAMNRDLSRAAGVQLEHQATEASELAHQSFKERAGF